MDVQHFFDKDTSTLSYIVYDAVSKDAIVIDPVLNYDMHSGVVEGKSLQEMVVFLREHKLFPHYCLETHAHADHLSSSQFLKEYFPEMKIAISENICKVQKTFRDILNLDDQFKVDGSQFDKLINDYENIFAGSIKIVAIPTPGHTPACMSFQIENMLFCGDSMFIEDSGTGRCDFPDGSAALLFQSVHENLYKLPENTIVFVGHDYAPNGRGLRIETTIGVSKRDNTQLRAETHSHDFIKFREERDKTLAPPKLLFPSIQVNINAGLLPKEIKIPVINRVGKI